MGKSFPWVYDDARDYVNERLREANYRWHLREAEAWARLLEGSGSKDGMVVRFHRIEYLPVPQKPKCAMCQREAWIFVDHPLSGESVCLECRKLGTPGWVPCPATHKNGGACVLCRKTPGFIEEAR